MKRVYSPGDYFRAADGTEVSAFLNATDATQEDTPWGVLGEVSIAAGRIGPGVHSWIHLHLVVTQVTYLLSGALTVRMKDAAAAESYELRLGPGEAVVAEPGTLFQLRNDGDVAAEVLYVVSPPYVFETEGDVVRHDDAALVARTWEDVANAGPRGSSADRYEALARRAEALRRLAARRGVVARPLAAEDVHSLRPERDYLAPDGSEIRQLVRGEHGSFAHCVLPAGKASAPVQHRTVEELWYVLEGVGEVLRGRDGEPPRRDVIRVGDSIRVPVGTAFQFRAAAEGDLKLLLATMPPWPGAQEAVQEPGFFSKTE